MQKTIQNKLLRVLGLLALYVGLRFFGGDIGAKILYPITLFVTFLHEFGHAVGALITGGRVLNLQVNPDGSGVTTTAGGMRSIILLGGYVGSAIFGNLLLYLGVRKPQISHFVLYFLASAMLISGLIWFSSGFTTLLLIGFALTLYFVAAKRFFEQDILMFLGLASLLYIIQDFRVGPSSDLAAYAELFVFVPVTVWMYVWLAVVLLITYWNVRSLLRAGKTMT